MSFSCALVLGRKRLYAHRSNWIMSWSEQDTKKNYSYPAASCFRLPFGYSTLRCSMRPFVDRSGRVANAEGFEVE